jgi:uncharacterized protein GlcG (DUF336 family)
MPTNSSAVVSGRVLDAIESLLPEFLRDPADFNNNQGNVAACVIDAAGGVHGRMFGSDPVRKRQSFRIAWTKASQVWITGMKTGEYEAAVFAGRVDDEKFGIIRPDFIGWEGGQPFTLADGTRLSVGVSGMRGVKDLEIATRAVATLG